MKLTIPYADGDELTFEYEKPSLEHLIDMGAMMPDTKDRDEDDLTPEERAQGVKALLWGVRQVCSDFRYNGEPAADLDALPHNIQFDVLSEVKPALVGLLSPKERAASGDTPSLGNRASRRSAKTSTKSGKKPPTSK